MYMYVHARTYVHIVVLCVLMYGVYCTSTYLPTHVYKYTFRKYTQGMDPWYGMPRMKLEVLGNRINFLYFVHIQVIYVSSMYPD